MYPTRRPHLLALDLDGVLLRHPELHGHVAARAASYVRERMMPGARFDTAEDVNRRLYRAHGHTWRGLRIEYGGRAGSLADFNAWVYDDETMMRLEAVYTNDAIQQQGREAVALSRTCREHHIPTVVFSNAPTQWCICALEVLGMPCQVVVGSDHPIFMGRLVKPDAQLYTNLAHYLRTIFQTSNMQIHFVDDSLTNLAPVLHHRDWNPIWYQADRPKRTGSAAGFTGVHRVESLAEAMHRLEPNLLPRDPCV